MACEWWILVREYRTPFYEGECGGGGGGGVFTYICGREALITEIKFSFTNRCVFNRGGLYITGILR